MKRWPAEQAGRGQDSGEVLLRALQAVKRGVEYSFGQGLEEFDILEPRVAHHGDLAITRVMREFHESASVVHRQQELLHLGVYRIAGVNGRQVVACNADELCPVSFIRGEL